jgi:hypothetical protein
VRGKTRKKKDSPPPHRILFISVKLTKVMADSSFCANEELLAKKNSGCSLENQEYSHRDPQNLVGIVQIDHSRLLKSGQQLKSMEYLMIA